MTQKEINLLKRIPKKYREHIVSLSISKSNDYNDRGQQLNNYTVVYDNEEEHTFQNIYMMIELIKYYTTDDGYYVSG